MCCVDGNGVPITELGGNSNDKERIRKIMNESDFKASLLRVSESTLEDQAIETTAYPNLRLAVVSAREEGKPLINWLICGVLCDVTDTEDYEEELLEGFESTLSGKQFGAVVDALQEMTRALIHYKKPCLTQGRKAGRAVVQNWRWENI